MTKTKVSTVAIVVLSVLLAAALASTIVLAAFSFGRTATTTITFSSGVSLQVVSGIDLANGSWNTYSIANNGAATKVASAENSTTGIGVDAITVKNASDQAVRIAYAIKGEAVGATISTMYADSEFSGTTVTTAGTTAAIWSNDTGTQNFNQTGAINADLTVTSGDAANLVWFVTDAIPAGTSNIQLTKFLNTGYTGAQMNTLGTGITLTFYVVAVYDNATETVWEGAMQEAIAAGNFAQFSSADAAA